MNATQLIADRKLAKRPYGAMNQAKQQRKGVGATTNQQRELPLMSAGAKTHGNRLAPLLTQPKTGRVLIAAEHSIRFVWTFITSRRSCSISAGVSTAMTRWSGRLQS